MQRCPLCGGRIHYVGLHRVECETPSCANFVRAEGSTEHAESEEETLAAQYELWVDAFSYF